MSYRFVYQTADIFAQKKPPLMAGPLRGGGGGKGRAIKEKKLFLKLFFFFCCHLKIKIILLQTTYRNMDVLF